MISDRLQELNILPKKSDRVDSNNSDYTDNRLSPRLTAKLNPQKSITVARLEGLFLNTRDKIAEIFEGIFPTTGKSCPLTLNKEDWDYVIVLNNPDNATLKNKRITKPFAEDFYKKVFRKKIEANPHTTNIHYEQEKRAFNKVFKNLEDFEDGKAFCKGGKTEMQGEDFVDHGKITKDFMTLTRNALVYKLVGNLGLKVKQLMSISGKFIFLLIAADVNDLKLEAERISYSKHLEISHVDLLSLMPCDKALRPLNMLKVENETVKKLYSKVKRFYREVFGYDKQCETFAFGYPPTGVPDEEWGAYVTFLSLIREGIKSFKKSVKSRSRKLVLFQKLVKDSMQKVNRDLPKKFRLKNLWDRLGVDKEIAPYYEFKNFADESYMRKMWRYYTVDEKGTRCLFKNMEKIRLVSSIIDKIVDLGLLEEHQIVAGHFPLNNDWELNGKHRKSVEDDTQEDWLMNNFLINLNACDDKQSLYTKWRVSLLYNRLPLSKIRNYYGEKIALYFEFLRKLHAFLLYPCALGVIVFVLQQVYESDESNVVKVFNVIYSIIMTAWSTVFNEYWKQREASLAIHWGQTKFEQVGIPRGRYTGETRRSPVTDDLDEIHYPFTSRLKFFLLSASVTIFIILIVLSFVASFIVLKTTYTSIYIYYLASLGNAFQIQVFNFIYSKLAVWLTELENHKTRENYEDSLITKTFCFQFVNSFNSFFYIAFVKPYTIGCDISGTGQANPCMHELFIQLLIIFLVGYAKNLMELGLPFMRFHLKNWKNAQGQERLSETPKYFDIRAEIEQEVYKDRYLTRDFDGTISDYLELSILFGMLTLFAIAFPLSIVLAFIGLWLEMHTDRFKILYLVRRPVPLPVKDIGSWSPIFNAISVLSIFTNAGLFCFTASTFDNYESSVKFVVFGIVVIVLLIFRAQLQIWIPDILPKYETIAARHDFLISKILQRDKVEKIEEEVEAYDETLYFTKSRFN